MYRRRFNISRYSKLKVVNKLTALVHKNSNINIVKKLCKKN